MVPTEPRFLRTVELAAGAPQDGYPFDLPALRDLPMELGAVTILVGDNGTGKSTLVEAIAVATGFNAEGGGRNLRFATMATHSGLHAHVRLRWKRRPAWGWFLRGETFYGMATHIAQDADISAHLPDLHGVSHGESFLALIGDRFPDRGFYVMDEPESALSFQGQLALLRFVHDGVQNGSQFLIATHSPLLMRARDAVIYELDGGGMTMRDYEDLKIVALWRRFMDAPDKLLDALYADD